MKNNYLILLACCITVISCKTSSKMTVDATSIESKLVAALKWQEANPIQAKAPTDWTNGAYYTGVVRGQMATQNPAFLNALTSMAERNKWETYIRNFHADDIAISYAYLYLNQLGKPTNLGPTDAFIQSHLNDDHDWKRGVGNADQVILWWWCDALFMAPPVLVKRAKMEGNTKLIDQMHTYYMQTYDLLYDKEEQLFARDLRFVWKGNDKDMKEKNGKKVFWSRGNGWVIAGLALMLDEMPKNYVHRPFYEKLYKEMAEKLLAIQPASGLWSTSLLHPESYNHGEVSGSGFHTFALAWGVNNGMLDKAKYTPAIKKAWTALAECQQSTGKVGWVQNIGAFPEPASVDSWQNFGSGAFIMAGAEVMKMKN